MLIYGTYDRSFTCAYLLGLPLLEFDGVHWGTNVFRYTSAPHICILAECTYLFHIFCRQLQLCCTCIVFDTRRCTTPYERYDWKCYLVPGRKDLWYFGLPWLCSASIQARTTRVDDTPYLSPIAFSLSTSSRFLGKFSAEKRGKIGRKSPGSKSAGERNLK